MRERRAWAVFCSAVLALLPAAPALGSRIAIGPAIASLSGQTQYDQDLDIRIGATSHSLRSLLEYPLDTSMAGVRAEATISNGRGKGWTFAARYLVNVEEPRASMVDSDWYDDVLFSYTESPAQLNARLFDLEAGRILPLSDRSELALIGGFRYQSLDLRMIGLEGFQKPFQVLGQFGRSVSVSDPRLVLTYEQVSRWPYIGLAPAVRLHRRVRGELRGIAGPAHLSDVDDHVLRNRLATAEAYGIGLEATARVRWEPTETSPHPRFGLEVGVARQSASADQVQRWYGNDSANDVYDARGRLVRIVDDTGAMLEGIPHQLTVTQFLVGIDASVGF